MGIYFKLCRWNSDTVTKFSNWLSSVITIGWKFDINIQSGQQLSLFQNRVFSESIDDQKLVGYRTTFSAHCANCDAKIAIRICAV